MEIAGKVAVVTGGASGIGKSIGTRFVAEKAAGVVLADRNGEAAAQVAAALGATATSVEADVTREEDVKAIVAAAEAAFGPVDIFCSNAGIGGGRGIDAPDDVWQKCWDVHVMAHVYAARAVVPGMLDRGAGYLVNTASAAGLLTNLGNAPYSVTKHAAVSLAEWMSIHYGDRGLRVSCLCPQGVRTPMLMGGLGAADAAANAVLLAGGMVEPEDVAEAVVNAMREERFLILPHPEVAEYVRRKGDDPDRWLGGMRRSLARLRANKKQ